MKITVCELSNRTDELEQQWQMVVEHVRREQSDLLLLPEMPFYPWLAESNRVDEAAWRASVEAHERWLERFVELGETTVLSTRPVIKNNIHLNEGYVWSQATGYQAVHHKHYLPNDAGWWEASWYQPGEKQFNVVETAHGRVGFLICTELWFNQHALDYAEQAVDIIVTPRATGLSSIDKWVAGGRTAAVVAGAFSLSSNFSPRGGGGNEWGGCGWVIEPEEGDVLGVTSVDRPVLTLEIDRQAAKAAKNSYPRNVLR